MKFAGAQAIPLPFAEFARRYGPTIIPAPIWWVVLFLPLGLFGRLMTFPVGHDEQGHVTAARLFLSEPLYGGLGYNHFAGLPLLLHAFYALTGSDHILQAGRVLIFMCWIATAGTMWLIARRQTGETRICCVGILVMVAGVLLGPAGMLVTNNFLPIPFALLAFHLFFVAVEGESVRPLPMFGAGLAIGFAVSLKISYIFLLPPFAIVSLIVPFGLPLGDRVRLVLLPLLGGGMFGGLPVLVPLLSDPAALYDHTVGYFTTGHLAYWQSSDAPKAMSFVAKFLVAESVWFGGSGLLAAVLVGVSGIVLARRNPARLSWWPILLVLALAACAAIVSFTPTPAFPQYYEPPIPFLIVLFFLVYRQLDEPARSKMKPLLATVGVLALAAIMPRIVADVPSAMRWTQWTGDRIHTDGKRIRDIVDASGAKGKVATLAPIVVLEGKLPIYREFGAGPFVYRVADFMSEAERRHFVTTSPRELNAFLDRDPPAAIVTGYEPELDPAFEDYARSRGYIQADIGSSATRLFVKARPRSSTALR